MDHHLNLLQGKLLAVPIDKLTPLYRNIETPRDLPEVMISQITHFFGHYKDLEPGKWVRIEGWVGPEEAKAEILLSVKRYESKLAGEKTVAARVAPKKKAR